MQCLVEEGNRVRVERGEDSYTGSVERVVDLGGLVAIHVIPDGGGPLHILSPNEVEVID